MEILEVYEVRGDFRRYDNGRVLGIFSNEAEALKNAEGCGSFDVGGDGEVNLRKAIGPFLVDGKEKYYLLEDNAVNLDVMGRSEAKELHSNKMPPPTLQERVSAILKVKQNCKKSFRKGLAKLARFCIAKLARFCMRFDHHNYGEDG